MYPLPPPAAALGAPAPSAFGVAPHSVLVINRIQEYVCFPPK